MFPTSDPVSSGAAPCQADPAPLPDLRGLDRVAMLVFAVLIALAALVAADLVSSGGDFDEAPVAEESASQ